MKRLTMQDVRRAYEKIDRGVYISGSSNWCAVMADALNVELAKEEPPRTQGKLVTEKITGYTGDPEPTSV